MHVERGGERSSPVFFGVMKRILILTLLLNTVFSLPYDLSAQSKGTADSLFYDFLVHYQKHEYSQAKELMNRTESAVLEHYGNDSEEYEIFLTSAIDVCLFTYDYASSVSYCHKYEDFLGEDDVSRQKALVKYGLASALYKLGDKESALVELQHCIAITETFPDSSDKYGIMASVLNLKGSMISDSTPREAVKLFRTVQDLYEKIGANETYLVSPLINEGMSYAYLNDFTNALICFEKVSTILEKNGMENSLDYLNNMNNTALAKINLGDLAKGMDILDKTAEKTLGLYGDKNELYASILQNMVIYYARVFDFQNMLHTASECADIWASIDGRSSHRYGMAMQNLGLANLYAGKYSEARKSLNEAISILTGIYGPHHFFLSYAYHNLGLTEFHEHKYTEADASFAKCWQIMIENNMTESVEYIGFLVDYGRCLLLLGSKDSSTYLKEAKRKCDEYDLQNHPIYLQLMSFCLGASFLGEQTDSQLISQTVETLYSLYKENITTFTSAERRSYWSKMNNIKNLLFSYGQAASETEAIYDYLLLSKGLLLGTDISFSDFIEGIDDTEIKNGFAELKSLRSIISAESMKPADKRSTGLNSMRTHANSLERDLIFKSRKYGNYADEHIVRYHEVTEALGKREAAVEFVSFTDFSQNDEIQYAALIAKPEWDEPIYVNLFHEKEIENLINNDPDKLYSSGYIGNTLYDKIWRPLEQYLKKTDRIFFSPSGVLYQIAVESLCDDKGKYLSDRYDMVRCSSTGIVCRDTEDKHVSSAVLYGGLMYDVPSDTMIELSEEYSISPSPELYAVNTDSEGLRAGWKYLSGTKSEVEKLSSVLSDYDVEYVLYEGENGNEESFKALSGTEFDILHIATHGFFLTKEAATRSEYINNNTSLQEFYENSMKMSAMQTPFGNAGQNLLQDDAMVRSGLLMSGGNMAWKGEKIPSGIEDGVLTAADISSLNLTSTDMVVMSACETGLGEVSDEGVLGLQRAFKNAGVDTVVMSLWKVDDHATEQMMTAFYKYLLSGDTKSDAFAKAKNEVRKQYQDPFYWAAFIMLD